MSKDAEIVREALRRLDHSPRPGRIEALAALDRIEQSVSGYRASIQVSGLPYELDEAIQRAEAAEAERDALRAAVNQIADLMLESGNVIAALADGGEG